MIMSVRITNRVGLRTVRVASGVVAITSGDQQISDELWREIVESVDGDDLIQSGVLSGAPLSPAVDAATAAPMDSQSDKGGTVSATRKKKR